jgi:hypothetical protein
MMSRAAPRLDFRDHGAVPPPTEPPADIASLFAGERRNLLELLATVGAPEWQKPSPCPEWTNPFRLAAIEGEPGDTVSIEVSGPVTATWLLVATDAEWSFASEPRSEPLASLSMTADQAWRLLSNNLAVDEQSRLHLSGDERVKDVIRRTRAIIGSPS